MAFSDSARSCSSVGSGRMIAGGNCRQRKVRTPQGKEVRNTNWGRPRGKCHRKQTAGQPVRVKRWGKSPPLAWRHARHGKPLLEQNQIGKRLRAARPKLPGRLQEMPGNRHPQRNDHGPCKGVQNPAYSPLPFFIFDTCRQQQRSLPQAGPGYAWEPPPPSSSANCLAFPS